MSKAVMLSIRPEWVEKIVNGEKTIDVRKTRPNLNTPFKCYIYCTKERERLLQVMKDGDDNYGETYHGKPVFVKTYQDSGPEVWGKFGKVIGEFSCRTTNRIYQMFDSNGACADYLTVSLCGRAYMRPIDFRLYGKGRPLFWWDISDLEIYDKPKELWEFRRVCPNDLYCESCAMYSDNGGICNNGALPLRRPPQSWQYVEG